MAEPVEADQLEPAGAERELEVAADLVIMAVLLDQHRRLRSTRPGPVRKPFST